MCKETFKKKMLASRKWKNFNRKNKRKGKQVLS